MNEGVCHFWTKNLIWILKFGVSNIPYILSPSAIVWTNRQSHPELSPLAEVEDDMSCCSNKQQCFESVTQPQCLHSSYEYMTCFWTLNWLKIIKSWVHCTFMKNLTKPVKNMSKLASVISNGEQYGSCVEFQSYVYAVYSDLIQASEMYELLQVLIKTITRTWELQTYLH